MSDEKSVITLEVTLDPRVCMDEVLTLAGDLLDYVSVKEVRVTERSVHTYEAGEVPGAS